MAEEEHHLQPVSVRVLEPVQFGDLAERLGSGELVVRPEVEVLELEDQDGRKARVYRLLVDEVAQEGLQVEKPR